MEGIILFEGNEGVKRLRLSPLVELEGRAVPFVGTTGIDKWTELGVGIRFPDLDKAYLWGLVIPHLMVQSWRGMKFLEHVEIIDPGHTLASCWYAGGDRKLEKSYTEHLSEAGIPYLKLQILRAMILNQRPVEGELKNAAQKLRHFGIDVDDVEE